MSKIKYLFVVCFILLAACKSTKQLAGDGQRTESQRTMRPERLVEKIQEQEPQFTTMQAGKMNATFVIGDRKISTGGTINYIADSIAIISIQPLFGIELFRLELTKSGAMLLDKVNKRYVRIAYDEMSEEHGMNIALSAAEDLFAGHLFAVGDSDYFEHSKNLKSLDIVQGESEYNLKFQESGVNHDFAIHAQTFAINKITFTMPRHEGEYVTVNYSNRQLVDEVNFPMQFVFEGEVDGKQAQCTINLLRVTFNGKVNVNQANLSRYKEVGIKDIF